MTGQQHYKGKTPGKTSNRKKDKSVNLVRDTNSLNGDKIRSSTCEEERDGGLSSLKAN